MKLNHGNLTHSVLGRSSVIIFSEIAKAGFISNYLSIHQSAYYKI